MDKGKHMCETWRLCILAQLFAVSLKFNNVRSGVLIYLGKRNIGGCDWLGM